MKFPLAILVLCAGAASPAFAQSNLTWRLQVEAESDSNAAANALRGQVQSIIRPQDIVDPERKTSPPETRDNFRGGSHVVAIYILRDEATATNALAQIVALRNPNISGRVTLHCCPTDGSVKDWGGCQDDARAKWREARF